MNTFLSFFIVGWIFVITTGFAVYSVSVDETKPYHPLFQISRTSTDKTSVDENRDGIIDHTNADIQEILSNGNVASIDLTINAKITSNLLDVIDSANINNAQINIGTINTLNVNTGTVSTLTVTSNLNSATITSTTGTFSSLVSNTLRVNSNSEFNVINANDITTNKLCLRKSSTDDTILCINNWEDLLDILYVQLA